MNKVFQISFFVFFFLASAGDAVLSTVLRVQLQQIVPWVQRIVPADATDCSVQLQRLVPLLQQIVPLVAEQEMDLVPPGG